MGKAIEYITRDKAKEIVCGMCRWEGTDNCSECEHPVDDLPAADVRPVVRGKWREEMVVGGFAESWESTCSICGKGYRDIGKPNYCPNCGALMEES